MAFLKSHRKMLTHMAWSGAIELEQAESAHRQACRDFGQARTQENTTLLCKAVEWVSDRSQNMEQIAHTWQRLDEDHLYILGDHGEEVPLTDREKQWSITIRQELATASVANAPPPPSSPPPESKAVAEEEAEAARLAKSQADEQLRGTVGGAQALGPQTRWVQSQERPQQARTEWPGSASNSRSPVPPLRQVPHARPEPPPPKAKPLPNRVPPAPGVPVVPPWGREKKRSAARSHRPRGQRAQRQPPETV